jgi:hypothetical protein
VVRPSEKMMACGRHDSAWNPNYNRRYTFVLLPSVAFQLRAFRASPEEACYLLQRRMKKRKQNHDPPLLEAPPSLAEIEFHPPQARLLHIEQSLSKRPLFLRGK